MTAFSSTTGTTWVAIDIAKAAHQVLVETPDGRRRALRVANTASEIERLVTYLRAVTQPCVIAFEPTGDYHRAVMHCLGRAGFALRQVSSLAVARTRDAMFNSWDKNDPKDAQVIHARAAFPIKYSANPRSPSTSSLSMRASCSSSSAIASSSRSRSRCLSYVS